MRLCKHFGKCGGCAIQDIPYSSQLDMKQKILCDAAGVEDVSIIPSPEIFGFRNKMEYSFESDGLGLHPRGSFSEIVDLDECPVFSEWIGPFLQSVRSFAAKNSIPYFSRLNKKEGILRHLIVRESKFTGDKLVILVTDRDKFSHTYEFAEMVKGELGGSVSVLHARRFSRGDSAVSNDIELLTGPGRLRMKLGNKEMHLSPYSFFQPNSYQVENIYSWILDRIEPGSGVLDLFCGIGTMPVYFSDKCSYITGVENFPACIEDARFNLEKIKPAADIDFELLSVRKYLSEKRSSESFPYDYAVLDPPRGGMSYRIWKYLGQLNEKFATLKRVFYVSCSMRNLKEDMQYIRDELGWELVDITGIDQFVHTRHLEAVMELRPV
jgi:23S rRNA (uracil1939-C5)-methyltransferase